MRYLIRAFKYYIKICLLASALVAVLAVAGFVEKDINLLFEEGWISVAKIAGMFALVALVYPRFGYSKRKALVPGDTAEVKPVVLEAMADKEYVLENDSESEMTFRLCSTYGRVARLYEDRITLKRDYSGFEVEGLTKDVVRVVYALESKASAAADRAE